jgi:hypothetical protein
LTAREAQIAAVETPQAQAPQEGQSAPVRVDAAVGQSPDKPPTAGEQAILGAVVLWPSLAVVLLVAMVRGSLDGVAAVAAVLALIGAAAGFRRGHTDGWRVLAKVAAIVGCTAGACESESGQGTLFATGAALVCSVGFASPLLVIVATLGVLTRCVVLMFLYALGHRGETPHFFLIGLIFYLAFVSAVLVYIRPARVERGRATVIATCSLIVGELLMGPSAFTGGRETGWISIPYALSGLATIAFAVVLAAWVRSRPLVWASTIQGSVWIAVGAYVLVVGS